MKGYQTSKDYKRLKELLDEGKEVLIIIPHFYGRDNMTYLAKKTKDPVCKCECYDLGIGF